MPKILTKQYRVFLAEQFKYAIENDLTYAYVFIGRSAAWEDADDETINDSNPPTPVDTVQNVDFEYWRDMLGAKRVAAANTALVVSRRNWTSGTVYDQYDDQNANLHTSAFYVLDTSELPYRVYKCLWNDNGAESTVAPSTIGNSAIPESTLDGYVWQFMYEIQSDNYRFLTENWMPVLSDSTVVSTAEANAGKLPLAVPLLIEDGGASYNASLSVATTLTGDGTGALVSADGVSIVSGAVTQIVLSAGGSGYTEVPTINVFQSGATPATVRALIPPYPNHGADPVKELGASTLMVTVAFTDDESEKLTINNDFRRNGLLINPLTADGETADATYYRQTWDITFSANTGVLQPDDVITNISKDSAPTALVVDVIDGPDSNYIVRLTDVNVAGESDPFVATDTLKCLDTDVEITIDEVSEPELQRYSGSIVFVNQRTPVIRDADLAEEIKILFPFG